MTLALFDLDGTLLAGDSDFLWGEFLSEQGYGDDYLRRHKHFNQLYQEGTLDIMEFLRFQLAPLSELPMAKLERWRCAYLERKIRPRLLPAAFRLVEWHRSCGHEMLIITATNRFLTAPIAELFGIEHLLATEPELRAGRYTGEVKGVPCYAAGKIHWIRKWLHGRSESLQDSWFYSDSHNDLPLLSEVGSPIAVDPDPKLRAEAKRRGWRIISLCADEQRGGICGRAVEH